jgi:type I restriction enzyme, S subunit
MTINLVQLTSVAPLASDRVNYFEGKKQYVATGAIDDYESILEKFINHKERPSRADLIVKKNDVCFARMQNTKKIILINDKRSNFIYSTGFAVLRSNTDKIIPEYLFHLINSPIFQSIKDSMCTGATQKAIINNKINKIKIFLPSLTEQKNISEILDSVNIISNKNRQTIIKLNELTNSLFMHMFGDPFKNVKKYPKIILGKLLKSGPQNGLYKPSSSYGSGSPILRIDSFYDGSVIKLDSLKKLRLTKKEVDLFSLNENDLIINRVNSLEYLGKSTIIPSLKEKTVFESNMMRFSVNENLIDPFFLIQYLQTKFVKSQILSRAKNAVNQSSINQQDVKGIEINLPTLKEQKDFTKKINKIQFLQYKSNKQRSVELISLISSLQSQSFTVS